MPKLQLNEATLRRNLLNEKKPTLFQHIARFHSKFGLRHVVLVLLLVLYSLGGGWMFLALESGFEKLSLERNKEVLQQLINEQSDTIFNLTHAEQTKETQEKVELVIR